MADNLSDFVQVLEVSRVSDNEKLLEKLLEKVAPNDKDYFTKGFKKLLKKGCEPFTLASTVFYFYIDHPYSSRPDMTAFSFPPSRELKKYKNALDKAVEAVQQLNDYYHIVETLADEHGGLGLRSAEGEGYEVEDERPREEVIRGLEWYRTLLSHWQVPRKDIVEMCAPYYCCFYTEVATEHIQFALVSQMLECLGYKPNPNKQKRLKVASRTEGDSFAESLERNYRNFVATYPLVCDWLKRYLKTSHDWEKGPKSILGPPYPGFIMPVGPLKPEKTKKSK
jgi:hypothetical protein